MQQQPIDANTPLAVTLTAQEWNAVMVLLQDVQAPFRVTAPLIQKVQEQLLPAGQPPPQPVEN